MIRSLAFKLVNRWVLGTHKETVKESTRWDSWCACHAIRSDRPRHGDRFTENFHWQFKFANLLDILFVCGPNFNKDIVI